MLTRASRKNSFPGDIFQERVTIAARVEWEQLRTLAKAERALEAAKRDHEAMVKKIDNDLAAVERRSQAEDARWKKQKAKLEAALRRAND